MDRIVRIIKSNNLLGDGVRFLLAGGLNTFITLVAYQLFLTFLSPRSAYAVSWLVGISYLIIVYPAKVFPGRRFSLKRSTAAVLVYLLVFFICLWSLKEIINFGIHARIAVFFVLIVSTTLNFFLMRLIYRGRVG